MSTRSNIMDAIQLELDAIAEENVGMEKPDGSGVQSQTVKLDDPTSGAKTEKKKGFKLTGGGQTVGGDAGGVTESTDAIEKADGNGMQSRQPKEVDGTDAKGAPTNGGEAEGASKSAIDKAKGSTVASPKAKASDGKSAGGGTNANAIEKAKGKSVASTSVTAKENVIELPHDTLVEDEHGNQKTLPKGTKIVIGEMMDGGPGPYDDSGFDCAAEPIDDMGMDDGGPGMPPEDDLAVVEPEVGSEDLITRIVTAVVSALGGAGEYDYAMEGKEIEIAALLEDTKKILAESGKPWEEEEENDADNDKDGDEIEECDNMESIEKSFGSVLGEDFDFGDEEKEEGESEEVGEVEDEAGDEFGGAEEGEGEDEEEAGEDAMMGSMGEEEIDRNSPDYVAALVDDIGDDLDSLKNALGIGSEEEDSMEEEEVEEVADDGDDSLFDNEGLFDSLMSSKSISKTIKEHNAKKNKKLIK